MRRGTCAERSPCCRRRVVPVMQCTQPAAAISSRWRVGAGKPLALLAPLRFRSRRACPSLPQRPSPARPGSPPLPTGPTPPPSPTSGASSPARPCGSASNQTTRPPSGRSLRAWVSPGRSPPPSRGRGASTAAARTSPRRRRSRPGRLRCKTSGLRFSWGPPRCGRAGGGSTRAPEPGVRPRGTASLGRRRALCLRPVAIRTERPGKAADAHASPRVASLPRRDAPRQDAPAGAASGRLRVRRGIGRPPGCAGRAPEARQAGRARRAHPDSRGGQQRRGAGLRARAGAAAQATRAPPCLVGCAAPREMAEIVPSTSTDHTSHPIRSSTAFSSTPPARAPGRGGAARTSAGSCRRLTSLRWRSGRGPSSRRRRRG